MDGNGLFLLLCQDFGLFLKTADDAVNGIKEILFVNGFLVVACSNECCFVAYIRDVGSRETRCLARKKVHVNRRVKLQRTHVYSKDCLTLVEVGQVNMYLPVESACA